MRCRVALILAVGIALSIAGPAWAFPPSNPYKPTVAQIQASIDRTGDFSGNAQASTETHSNIASGISVNADWFTGGSGLFGGTANEGFTRLVLVQRYPGDTGDGDGGDLGAFDGVSWIFTSDIAISVKPYTQTYNGFTFYEGTQPTAGCGAGTICVPGGNVPTVVQIDWNTANPGGSVAAADRDNVFEHGFQIYGPSPAQDSGTHITSVFTITQVPEPTTLALAGIGSLAMVAIARRRLRK
jgi:PEP-CTERM motif